MSQRGRLLPHVLLQSGHSGDITRAVSPTGGHDPDLPFAVGSRTGAPTLGSGGCSTAFAVALSPAAMVTFPAPAASNVACEFLALRSPVRFVPKLMDLFDRDDFPQITT